VIPSPSSHKEISWKPQLDYPNKKLKQIKSYIFEPSIMTQIEENNKGKEDFHIITKKLKNVDPIDDHNHISQVDIHFKKTSLGDYTIDDMLFNVLSVHDAIHPSESPLAISTLLPFDILDNQTYFIYTGPYFPSYQVLKVDSK